MARIILGTIVGFFLGTILFSLIGETELYYLIPESLEVFLGIMVSVLVAIIGGFLGSKMSSYNTRQTRDGRVRNKSAEDAGKIMVAFSILLLFVLATFLDVQNEYPYIEYVYYTTLMVPFIASIFAIRAVIQIRKSKEIGMFVASSVLVLSSAFYAYFIIVSL